MKVKDLIYLVGSDLYRYEGRIGRALFARNMMFNPGFKYTFWMRVCTYLMQREPCKYPAYLLSSFMLARYRYKYGIEIPHTIPIGGGLLVVHFGGIVVGAEAIGSNLSISQGVAIGSTYRGDRKGCPTIGDDVYIGPGAKVIGRIRIGNRVAIGANCVVTQDIPDDAVVVGVPGKVISYDGSQGYVANRFSCGQK
jgi:serine O-acetyltransferase